MSDVTPVIIEKTDGQSQVVDIYSRLMQERIIMLGGVDDESSDRVVAQMLYLNSLDPEKDILLFINSPGGSVTAGMAIYDTMHIISNDVKTICSGHAASMGALLLTAGPKGKRYALPNARIMIHQPLWGWRGTASEADIAMKEGIKLKNHLNKILQESTGRTLEEIDRDTDRDTWLNAEEAMEYGLIDHVVKSLDDLKG